MPVRAKVHTAFAKSSGCKIDECRPKEGGGNAVSRTALLMLLLMAGVLLLASGVALAKNISGTEAGEKIVGTKFKDHINSLGGDDVVLGYAGADKIRGGDDVIYSEGGFRDLVNCGKGTDTAYVDSKDQVVGCERKR